MMTAPTSPLAMPTTAPTSMTPATATGREQLSGVAKQFEAIFLRQMLAAARKTNFGGEDNIFSGQGLDTFRQMQDERFAEIASETGTLGLGKMIEAHLARLVSANSGGATIDAAMKQEAPGNGI